MTTDTIHSSTPRGFVTVADAAEASGVSIRTLARWCELGTIKGAKRQEWPGRYPYRWLVPARWVAANTKGEAS